jgi:hypothetical protein
MSMLWKKTKAKLGPDTFHQQSTRYGLGKPWDEAAKRGGSLGK